MIRLLFLSLVLATTVFAQSPDKAILVLDASGSMWGTIDGRSKIETARDVVSNLLRDWPKEQTLGLVAYGHRQKGDCNDIETIVAPAPLDATSFEKKVRALNPMGKTPMVASVRYAAEVLKYSEEPATVILISDGEETCEADPCAIAKELEAKGIKFTAHVIGFDLKNAGQGAAEQMKCIAEATGGKFLTADNASELNSALKTVTAPVIAEPIIEKKVEAKPVNNFHAIAKLSEDSEPLTKGVSWEIAHLLPENQKGEMISYSYDPEYETSVAPGKYILTVAYGNSKLLKPIEVTDQKLDLTLILDAGNLKLKAFAGESEQIKEGIFWELKDQAGELVAYSYESEPTLTVTQGKYNLSTKWGEALLTTPVEIIAGKSNEQSISMAAGILKAKAFATTGGEQLKDSLNWSVDKLISALENKYEQVSYSYDAEPTFKLLAGKYLLKVKWGEATAEQEVTVASGLPSDTQIVLNAGVLKLSVKSESNMALTGFDWKVFKKTMSLTGTRTDFAYSFDASPQFLLPAGDYEIELKTNSGDSKLNVKIEAGQRTEQEVVLK